MNVPTKEDLKPPTLAAMAELGDDASIHQIHDQVVSFMGLSRNVSRSTLLTSRLNAARIELRDGKPPLILNRRRGYWSLTSKGRRIFRNMIPKDEDLMAPTLDAISELSENSTYGADNDAIHDRVVDVKGLPSFLVKYKSENADNPLIHSRINTAKTKLRKAGLIESRKRGYWSLAARRISVDQNFGREQWTLDLTDKPRPSAVRIESGNRNRVILEEVVEKPDGTKTTRRAIFEIDDMDAAETVRRFVAGDRLQLPGRRR